jgi:hypothetical protein
VSRHRSTTFRTVRVLTASAATAALAVVGMSGVAAADADNSQRIACEDAHTCIPVHAAVNAPITVPVDVHDVNVPIANDLDHR